METFEFPCHESTWTYPKGTSFKFGGGYEFSVEAQAPLQRTFTLTFRAMVWERNPTTNVFDPAIRPETNILALIQFYEAHRTHKAFIYPHDVYGDIVCKFSSEANFQTPKAAKGSGATDSFEVVLVEQPL
jgi:hypothetical protein